MMLGNSHFGIMWCPNSTRQPDGLSFAIFAVREAGFGPSRRPYPSAHGGFRSKQTQDTRDRRPSPTATRSPPHLDIIGIVLYKSYLTRLCFGARSPERTTCKTNPTEEAGLRNEPPRPLSPGPAPWPRGQPRRLTKQTKAPGGWRDWLVQVQSR